MIVDPKQDRSLLIPHTVQPPAAAATPALTDEAITPTLTGEQECQREEIEGIIWANTSSKAPAQAQEIEGKIRRMNQPGGGFKEPFTPNQLQHILTEEQVRAAEKLKKEIFEKGVHPAELPKLIRECHEFGESDIGNGERFAARWAGTAKYCHPRKAWYLWDGTRWKEDQERAVYRKAKVTARAIYREVDLFLSDEDAKRRERSKWAGGSAGKKRLEDMLFLATSEKKITVHPDELDADGNLFNLQNGTLELDTLTFREHRKVDLLTKMAGVAYDSAADCPLWKAHLRLIFDGKEDLIQAFQEHIGYCLLSGNPLQIFEIWWGKDGFNGKSVTLKTIGRVFGGYATSTNPNTFMEVGKDGNAPKPELLALRGARLVISAENKKDAVLAEDVVKNMTGGEPIITRGLFKETESFFPEYTAILASNYPPRILGTDDAIWRRIIRWPFTVKIAEDQRVLDYNNQLAAEATGILNWMIEGLRRYYAAGKKFNDPPELMESTRKYRSDQDVLLKFIEERCVLEPGASWPKAAIYTEYSKWCTDQAEEADKPASFYKAFQAHNFKFGRKGADRAIMGIRTKSNNELEELEHQKES